MDTLSSWLLISTILFGIGWVMTTLYAKGQTRYVEFLKRELEETKPPF